MKNKDFKEMLPAEYKTITIRTLSVLDSCLF